MNHNASSFFQFFFPFIRARRRTIRHDSNRRLNTRRHRKQLSTPAIRRNRTYLAGGEQIAVPLPIIQIPFQISLPTRLQFRHHRTIIMMRIPPKSSLHLSKSTQSRPLKALNSPDFTTLTSTP
ncbi:hypothetical protein Hanom_Chr05g00437951 [Helianthus anomalus]